MSVIPRWARQVAGAVFIAALVISAFATGRAQDRLRADVQTNANSVDRVEEILADVCKAAPAKNVDQSGRERECQLARAGKIEETVPVVQAPISRAVSRAQIEQVVDSYLDNRLRELPNQYRSDLRASVVAYLRANPPKNGANGKPGPPPSAQQIAAVVAAYVAAHPPPAGKDGERGKDGEQGAQGEKGTDGVSVTGTALDGCDLVFSFSNDTTVRVGPVCGPAGPEGKPGEPGRGVASQDCVAGDDVDEDGDGVVPATDWLITYDKPDADGKTAQRVDGPCRTAQATTPPPSTPTSPSVTSPGLLGR